MGVDLGNNYDRFWFVDEYFFKQYNLKLSAWVCSSDLCSPSCTTYKGKINFGFDFLKVKNISRNIFFNLSIFNWQTHKPSGSVSSRETREADVKGTEGKGGLCNLEVQIKIQLCNMIYKLTLIDSVVANTYLSKGEEHSYIFYSCWKMMSSSDIKAEI